MNYDTHTPPCVHGQQYHHTLHIVSCCHVRPTISLVYPSCKVYLWCTVYLSYTIGPEPSIDYWLSLWMAPSLTDQVLVPHFPRTFPSVHFAHLNLIFKNSQCILLLLTYPSKPAILYYVNDQDAKNGTSPPHLFISFIWQFKILEGDKLSHKIPQKHSNPIYIYLSPLQ